MKKKLLVITTPFTYRLQFLIEREIKEYYSIKYADTDKMIHNISEAKEYGDVLISFLNGIIVPLNLLDKYKIAINIHPAPPQYPGRDVHHFAIYNRETEYGVTAHFMDKHVDSGRIIVVKRFPIPKNCTPTILFNLAKEWSYLLLEELLHLIISGQINYLPKLEDWGQIKFTRKMFSDMCRITTDLSPEEIKWRLFCFEVEGYQNIHTEIKGLKFFYKSNS